MPRMTSTAWSTEEVDILVENYRKMKPEALTELLPMRTRGAIIAKARKLCLRVKPGLAEWMKLIRENPTESTRRLALKMGTCETTAKKYRRIARRRNAGNGGGPDVETPGTVARQERMDEGAKRRSGGNAKRIL